MELTYKDKVLAYIKTHGAIEPSVVANHTEDGMWFGHSIDSLCRELFKEGILDRREGARPKKSGGFYVEYFLKEKDIVRETLRRNFLINSKWAYNNGAKNLEDTIEEIKRKLLVNNSDYEIVEEMEKDHSTTYHLSKKKILQGALI